MFLIRNSNLLRLFTVYAQWFKQMSSVRYCKKLLFFLFSFQWFNQLEPEHFMNKLQYFIIDWEKRCRCDNSWQSSTVANWKHSWRASRCSCNFGGIFLTSGNILSAVIFFLQSETESRFHFYRTISPVSLSAHTNFRSTPIFTTYFINMSFIIIIDLSNVNDDSL